MPEIVKIALIISLTGLVPFGVGYITISNEVGKLESRKQEIGSEITILTSQKAIAMNEAANAESEKAKRQSELSAVQIELEKRGLVANFDSIYAGMKGKYDSVSADVSKKQSEFDTIKSNADLYLDYEKNKDRCANLESESKKHYILNLEVRQSHFTLDIGEHMKDAMNATEFEIEVSKSYYDGVSEGSDILRDFRAGSFLIRGSVGDFIVRVKSKRIAE